MRIFQGEVTQQCRFIVAASKDLDGALGANRSDDAWRHIQTILVASATASRMLWGSGSNKKAEISRAPLRASLQVDDASPFRDPRLRNDFEHFDERLEEWYAGSSEKLYAGRMIWPHSSFGGVPEEERFHWYDSKTGTVTFWKHAVSIPELVAEAKRVWPIARKEANKPHWQA
jgi:hypothetical protein